VQKAAAEKKSDDDDTLCYFFVCRIITLFGSTDVVICCEAQRLLEF
jgi:hypothetical protein